MNDSTIRESYHFCNGFAFRFTYCETTNETGVAHRVLLHSELLTGDEADKLLRAMCTVSASKDDAREEA